MSEELTKLSALQLAGFIGRREISPVEVAEAHVRRIECANPDLNAVVTLAADVLDSAREAETAIMRGETGRPLRGVPLTVKDTIEARGMRATAGSKVRAGHVPRADAAAVGRLRAAGALILGKTNTSELALDYTTENPVFGRTHNPHDLRRTAGGSSGGCAAAVAAQLSAGSLGSDLAGSVRVPAHFCGVVGFKPTAARVPSAGHFPPVTGVYSLGASLGSLARSVEDTALIYGVLSGSETTRAGGSFAEQFGARALAELRGLRAAVFTDDGVAPVTEEMKQAVESAAAALRDAGLIVTDERPPGFENATDLWLRLFSQETRRVVCAAYRGREDEAGWAARLILDSASVAAAQTLEEFFDAWAERDRARSLLLDWMETTPLIVSPVGAVSAFSHDAARRFRVGGMQFGLFRAFGYAQAANVFDLPAAAAPAGLTRERVPVGVQIIGRPLEEWRVLSAARVIEETLGGWTPPPERL